MRYLDLLTTDSYENIDLDRTNEETKKGNREFYRRVTWISPKFGRCEGMVIDRDRDWLLVSGTQHRPDLAWIKRVPGNDPAVWP